MEAIQAIGEGENPANFSCTAESTIDKDLLRCLYNQKL